MEGKYILKFKKNANGRKQQKGKQMIPVGAKRRLPEEYVPDDIVYGQDGTRYRLVSFGNQGYGAVLEYLDGEKQGRRNYIAEVNWLYK